MEVDRRRRQIRYKARLMFMKNEKEEIKVPARRERILSRNTRGRFFRREFKLEIRTLIITLKFFMTDALRPRCLSRETSGTMAESPEVNSRNGVNFFPFLYSSSHLAALFVSESSS